MFKTDMTGKGNPNEMKYEEGETPPRCVQNGRKGDGGSPSPLRSNQKKCDEEGFPIVLEMEEKAMGEAPPHRVSNKSATKRVSPSCSK